MSNKNLTIGLIAVAIIAVSGLFTPVGKSTLGAIVDTSYFDYFDATTGYKLAGTSFLTATTFSLPSGISAMTENGVVTTYKSSALTTSTTTPCAMISPAATSTLESATIRVDVASSTATIWDIAKASTAYATTTAIGTAYTIAAGAQGFIHASTTPGAVGATEVIAPNSYIVFGVRQAITAGDAAGTGFVPSGRCRAVFLSTSS